MGRFVLSQVNSGVVFNLKAGNNEIIATSQVYASQENCLKGIESIRKIAPIAKLEDRTDDIVEVTNPKFEIFKDVKGEFRFRLKARNGEIVASSEGYKKKDSCLKGIESVRKNAQDAETVKA